MRDERRQIVSSHLEDVSKVLQLRRQWHKLWKCCLLLALSCLLSVSWHPSGFASTAASPVRIEVFNRIIGQSTRYIGTCEGNINFDPVDLSDLGINTYRLYGGMSRWETEDDDSVYGMPTIDQIKQDPSIIRWSHWDTVMTTPTAGSDYASTGDPQYLWQGNARTLFESLKQNDILPVLSLRTVNPGQQPAWASALNPPRTPADWNEWWEHVFATVYWLNVRNDYRVDHFEIANEPNNPQQGWQGSQEDYFDLVSVASDAITHVYSTYLPDRTFHIHAPKTTGGSDWPRDTLASVPSEFNTVNIHNYSWDITRYTRRVRGWMNRSALAAAPLWIGEWGTYTQGYNNLTFSLNLIKNMIHMSQPGDTYVYGSHLFSLYDWWGNDGGFEGLIDAAGNRRLSYYAFRMGLRALQGGRDILFTSTDSADLTALVTQSDQATIFLLVVNDSAVPHLVDTQFPLTNDRAEITLWEFSEANSDTVIEQSIAERGRGNTSVLSFQMPALSSRLIKIVMR